MKDTLNLPKTSFPMKANLAQREPEILQRWERDDIYGQIREARAQSRIFVLHDGPPYANGHIHHGHVLNKILKDLVVKSKTMAGFNTAYLPGWGLPRPADRARGGQDAGRSQEGYVDGPDRQRVPQVRPELHRHPARGVPPPGRAGRVGRALLHDALQLRGGDRAPIRRIRARRLRLQGPQAGALGHRQPHRAGRGGGGVPRPRLAVGLRRLPPSTATRRRSIPRWRARTSR